MSYPKKSYEAIFTLFQPRYQHVITPLHVGKLHRKKHIQSIHCGLYPAKSDTGTPSDENL